ncbi:MAG: glucosaminidase domain-containing protein [Flavobacteriia bacterium]|nr:glucosaminidase domain-containing protein [Flavobacteriia bacterium]
MNISIDDIKPFKYLGKTPKSDWYNWLSPMAKKVGDEYGIPWQAIMVQTALETGWGKSSLLRKYNNFGGIKSTKGQNSIELKTKEFVNGQWIEIKDGFATWETPYKGLVGYAQFFHKNKRYKNALKYPNDPYQFIVEIKKVGYATDPDYVSKLHRMLENDLKINRA